MEENVEHQVAQLALTMNRTGTVRLFWEKEWIMVVLLHKTSDM